MGSSKLCSFCVPQTGRLQLYDLASGTLLETIDAHDGALWSMSLSPDQVTSQMLTSELQESATFPFFLSGFTAA